MYVYLFRRRFVIRHREKRRTDVLFRRSAVNPAVVHEYREFNVVDLFKEEKK